MLLKPRLKLQGPPKKMSEKIFWPYSHFLLITVLSGFLGDYLPYKVKLCSYKAKFCSYKVISGLAIAL
jgi:hypothetical protein